MVYSLFARFSFEISLIKTQHMFTTHTHTLTYTTHTHIKHTHTFKKREEILLKCSNSSYCPWPQGTIFFPCHRFQQWLSWVTLPIFSLSPSPFAFPQPLKYSQIKCFSPWNLTTQKKYVGDKLRPGCQRTVGPWPLSHSVLLDTLFHLPNHF